MVDKTDTLVQPVDDFGNDDGDAFHWPYCAVPQCANRCSLRLNSDYCHPHSMGMEPITEKIKEKVSA